MQSDVYFGSADYKPKHDWRDKPDTDPDPDDEELPVTPPDVVAILGFDPLDWEDDETENSADDGE